jgi:DNA-binding GntR family transcriptional regulator
MASDATVTPIARPTIGHQVADVIRRQIWDGALRSGDRLNQEELASSLGVSRIPVREALMGLEREGVVRMAPHRGAFVEAIDERTVADHFELYALVDGFALRKACRRASPEELAALAELFGRAGEQHDPDDLQTAVGEARSLLHELGGSPRFRAVARGLSGIVPGNFFASVDGSVAIARSGLPLVAQAVAAGDSDGAVAAYTGMLTGQGRRVLADLQRRGVVGTEPLNRSNPRSPEGTTS